MIHPNYPTAAEVDAWCERLVARADRAAFDVQVTPYPLDSVRPAMRHVVGQEYVAITPAEDRGCTFHCLWQPAHSGGPAPLLVHLPGYGAEMTAHPTLAAEGFNVLHVNPRGYCSPLGFDESRKVNGVWPVLPETISSFGEAGYANWLSDVLLAVRWATQKPAVQRDRLGFFGTSQGGGTALLMASLLRSRGVKAVAADEPFLTGHAACFQRQVRGAYEIALRGIEGVKTTDPQRLPDAWRALGLVDTLSHAHRLAMPTLLTAGGADLTCPPESIRALFDALPATRSYTELAGQGHGYTAPFLFLATAWFRMYV